MVLKVEPGSLRVAAAALSTESKTLNGIRRELEGLGALGDKAAQVGLKGLVVAFGAAFDVLEQDLRFMSGKTTTAADTYERLDGHVLPQYMKEVAKRRQERLDGLRAPMA